VLFTEEIVRVRVAEIGKDSFAFGNMGASARSVRPYST
jgi:hypothetical protein